MTTEFEILSFGEMAEIIACVREGKSNPVETRRLISEFVRCASQGIPVPAQLIQYLRDGFSTYLNTRSTSRQSAGPCAIQAGNPGTSDGLSIQIAISVLRARLAGTTHQEALEIAGEDWDLKKPRRGPPGNCIKGGAIRSEARTSCQWRSMTQSEIVRLNRTFKSQLSVIPHSLRLPIMHRAIPISRGVTPCPVVCQIASHKALLRVYEV